MGEPFNACAHKVPVPVKEMLREGGSVTLAFVVAIFVQPFTLVAITE